MDFSVIDARLLSHPGASKAFQPKWGWWCYWVGGKQFACEFTVGPDVDRPYAGRHMVSLKCDPAWSERLREQYPDAIFPAYYSDGRTWISVDLDAVGRAFPEDLLFELCDHSYALVFAKLTKKMQREIAGPKE